MHRSLTQWLTDYVFTPFYRWAVSGGFVRSTFAATSASLLVTMLIAGVWHGATLNFVLFGLVHGVALVAVHGYDALMARWLGKAGFRRFSETPVVTVVAVILTYNFTSLAYIFFALDAADGLRVVSRLSAALAQGAG